MSSSSPIRLTGLGSSIPTEDIISRLMQIERRPLDLLTQKKTKLNSKDAQYAAVADRVKTVQNTLKTLTTTTTSDLFKKKAASTSDSTILTASAGNSAAVQEVSVVVNTLATSTKSTSSTGVGAIANGTHTISQMANGGVTDGNFTIYVNGTASTIAVASTDTINTVLGRISGVSGITGATIDGDGKFQVAFGSGTTVTLGASSDTTNFLNKASLSTGVATATSITGSSGNNVLKTNVAVENASAGFATGVTASSTFTIGTASFSTSGKTLADIISDINGASGSGVTASYNSLTNKLELTSKNTGNALITLSDTSGNFLTAAGLITGGNSTLSQTAGSKAALTVNGNTVYSNSNTVTETETGIAGLTLTLTKQDPATTVKVGITRDSSSLKSTLADFANSVNTLINYIDAQTSAKSKGLLAGDTSVLSFRSALRGSIASGYDGTNAYTNLAQIGLSTGSAGAGSSTASTTLTLDTSILEAKLAENPEAVRSLMIDSTNGLLTKTKVIIDNSIATSSSGSSGLFTAKRSGIQDVITSINESITKGEARLKRKEDVLRRQYIAMDQAIAQLQSQGSAISNIGKQ